MRYDAVKQAVALSVGELSFFACRKGDLETRRQLPKIDPDEAATVLEELLGENLPASARHLALATEWEGLTFWIEGTCAWARIGEKPALYGYRAGAGKPDPIEEKELLFLAHLLASGNELAEIEVGLVTSNEKGVAFHVKKHSAKALQALFEDALAAVFPFAALVAERAEVRLPSAASAKFPYPVLRDGQELLMRECYRDFKAGKILFAEAPTGIGKTASTLYPAIRALGNGVCDRVFYLTAKAAPRHEAYRTAAKLFEAGARLRTLVLTAREELCQNAAAKADPAGLSYHCNSRDCPMARGFYDRCDKAIFSLFSEGNGYPRTTILEKAKEYGICPYEFQLELLQFCDIVICDYNYIFDPFAYLRRCFAGEGDGKKNLFLVDEAHNLATRASEMYSASLTLTELRLCLEVLEPVSAPYETLLPLTKLMDGFRDLCKDSLTKDEEGVERGYELSPSPKEEVFAAVRAAKEELDAFLPRHMEEARTPILAKTLKSLARFSEISDRYDKRFTTFLEVEGDERKIRLICLDPSEKLSACLERSVGAVLFSATLTPLNYFADILGGGKRAVTLSLPSPFPPENLSITVCPGISTRYADREKSYAKLASIIAGAVSGKPGNYIAYFPSYAYLDEVKKRFSEKYPKVTLVVQSQGMGQGEKERFLSSFQADGKLRVGFCVLGGSFSEGVDLPGGRLIGSIVVGTGLPGISNERNILMEYYEKERERGFDYAYVYPGMNRVLQAAGRVIRTESDCGILVLVDDRYTDPKQKLLFPEHWKNIQVAGSAKELAGIVSEFWQSH